LRSSPEVASEEAQDDEFGRNKLEVDEKTLLDLRITSPQAPLFAISFGIIPALPCPYAAVYSSEL
jgi:hypothetical protein